MAKTTKEFSETFGARAIQSANATDTRIRTARKKASNGGARVHSVYHDRHEEYVPVTRDDLREIRSFGWMQQALFGAGTFLFSGAFWTLIELLAHQEHFTFTAWMGMCLISMMAGVVLAGIGLVLYHLRQKKLDKYFKEGSVPGGVS